MDSLFLYIESNSIFVLLLLVLLVNMGKANINSRDERLFRLAMILNIVVLVADTGCWIFDGRVYFNNLIFNKIVYAIYYIFTACFVMVWSLYVVYKVYGKWEKISRFKYIAVFPVVVAIIMSIASIWNGWLFKFTTKGIYIRGDFFIVHTIVLWLYMLVGVGFAIDIMLGTQRTRKIRECAAIIIAVAFPIVGGVLQTVYYGLNTAWTASCVSFVIIFISIQNKQMTTDALTGISNRGSFTRYIKDNIYKQVADKKLYLIMIDVNKFKHINDRYGHTAGDEALIKVAATLNEQCKKGNRNDYVARYGGDEFVIVCWRKDESEIKQFIAELHEECAKMKERYDMEFEITLSIGWAVYNANRYLSADEFISAADSVMYVEKLKGRKQETGIEV